MCQVIMKYPTFVLALALAIGLCLIGSATGQSLTVSTRDKKTIMNMVLTDALKDTKDFADCSTLILKNEKVVFLSTTNADHKELPKLKGIHLELMTHEEIENEIETNKGHCWVELGKLTYQQTGIEVHVTTWRVIHQCPKCIRDSSSTTFVYEATKESGSWKIKLKRKGFTAT